MIISKQLIRGRMLVWWLTILVLLLLTTCSPLVLVMNGTLKPRSSTITWNGLTLASNYVHGYCSPIKSELCTWFDVYYQINKKDGTLIYERTLFSVPILK